VLDRALAVIISQFLCLDCHAALTVSEDALDSILGFRPGALSGHKLDHDGLRHWDLGAADRLPWFSGNGGLAFGQLRIRFYRRKEVALLEIHGAIVTQRAGARALFDREVGAGSFGLDFRLSPGKRIQGLRRGALLFLSLGKSFEGLLLDSEADLGRLEEVAQAL